MINTTADPNKPGAVLHAKGVGNVILKTFSGNEERDVMLHNIYFVPNLRKNLMSVSQIEKKNKELLFREGRVSIRTTIPKQIMCKAYRRNDLYIVRAKVQTSFEETT